MFTFTSYLFSICFLSFVWIVFCSHEVKTKMRNEHKSPVWRDVCLSRRFGKVSTDTLLLSSNQIKEFRTSCFYDRLVYLDVSNNSIEEVPTEIVSCRRMRYVDFSGNHIDRIPSMFFPIYLESLLVGSNNLADLPNRLRNLDYLQTLDLHNNAFEKIPRVIYELDNLRYLDLSFNMIEKVSVRIARLPRLEVLDLTGNPLTKEDVERLRAVMPKGVEVRFWDPIDIGWLARV